MKVKQFLDLKIQLFNTYNELKANKLMTVRDVLTFGCKYKPLIDKARSVYDTDKKAYKEIKDRMFVWLPSVLIKGTKSDIAHTYPVICIDIDGKDNPDMDIETAKKQIISLPFVFYTGLSIGGNGIFALAYIEDPMYFTEHFKSLEQYFKDKFNLIIDPQCSNSNRLRYLSYDDNDYLKDEDEDIKPYTDIIWKEPEITYTPSLFYPVKSNNEDLIHDDRFCISVLDYCINKLFYQSGKRTEGWIQDLGLLKLFGCEGEQLALQLSRQSQGYVSDNDVLHTLYKGGLNSHRERMSKFFKMCKDSLGKGWIYKIKEMYNLE